MISAMETNLVVTVLAYVLTGGITLTWVFVSKQKRIPRNARTAMCISLRTLPLFLLFFVVCQRLGVNAVAAFAVLSVVLWAFLIGASGSCFGTIGVLYILQQWILGWPDRADLFLDPPLPHEGGHGHLDELIGMVGVANGPLRPCGVVVLDGKEYSACSDLGYIDRAAQVKVVGRKGTSLLVRPAASASGAPVQN
jgi:hypothetical protein